MVDSISGVNAPNSVTNNRTQARNETQRSENSSATTEAVDAVEISPEASEAQALSLAQETRSLLEQQQNEALTRTGQRVDQLL